jgi:hypothetical protein
MDARYSEISDWAYERVAQYLANTRAWDSVHWRWLPYEDGSGMEHEPLDIGPVDVQPAVAMHGRYCDCLTCELDNVPF